jgi:hypothetical protein
MPSVIDLTGIELEGGVELTLDGVPCVVRFQYNERVARWFVDLLDVAGVPVVAGRVLNPTVILNPRKLSGLPPGVFYATRVDGEDTPFSRDNFARECVFWYQNRDEYAAELAALTPDRVGPLTVRE